MYFKGYSIPNREVQEPDGGNFRECAGYIILPGSIIGTGPERRGIYTKMFQNWCSQFVGRVSYLNANNRKVLFITMALRTLQLGNIEAYALLSKTSGVAKTLDFSF